MSEPITTVLGAWLWGKYGDDFLKWLKEKAEKTGVEFAQKKWKAFQWQQAEKAYKEKLAKLHGTTRILGHSEPTPLDGIFTDLYILDRPLALRRYSIEDLNGSNEKLHGRDVQRCEGITVVKRPSSHRLFILGKPGAGKTTFLRYVTLQTVKGEINKTPIFIGLREWAESKQTLLEFIVAQFKYCNFPKADSFIEYLLEKGNAILLFDGLDEVNSEHNERIIKDVKIFCKQYDKTQCLITCRVASADYSFESFKYVEVADFTDEQIEIFVSKWFASEPIKRDKFLTDFRQAQYRGLRELASSPLLLGMLCLAFADSMEFTTRRVDIYNDAVDALLRKWDSSKSIKRDDIYHGLTRHLKLRLFKYIAYKTFSKNQYLFKTTILSYYLDGCLKTMPEIKGQYINGEVALKVIEEQHGIFVERVQDIHSFAHLTFQEYFTACAIQGNINYQKDLMLHINEPRWREVFLLTASSFDTADYFFELFKDAQNNLIKQDEELIEFLQWAEHKANSVQSDYQIKDVRFFYIVLELIISRNLDFEINLEANIELNTYLAAAIDCAIGFNLDLNSVSEFGLANTRNQFRVQDRNQAFDIIHERERVRDYARKRIGELNTEIDADRKRAVALEPDSKDMSCDYLLSIILMSAWFFAKTHESLIRQSFNIHEGFVNFYSMAVKKIDELGFKLVAIELTQLKDQVPNQTAAQNDWKLFIGHLSELLQAQRNIGEQQSFTNTQRELLANYFSANSLLLDCLKLAQVSDCEAIKNSLFLPPSI